MADLTTTTTSDLALLTGGAVRVDLGDRELIVATGADRVRFLHGIVTGNVAGTPAGRGARSALLTTKGHVVADLWIFARPDDLWIVVGAGQGEPTAAALSRYAIMDDFTAARREDFGLLGLFGPGAAERLGAIGLDPDLDRGLLASQPPLAHTEVRPAVGAGERGGGSGPLWLVRVHELGTGGFWIGGSRDDVAAAGQRLGAAGVPLLAPEAAEGARIAAVEPRPGVEITPDYFPMEVGLDGAIDYSKGCYLGQEPIVRIRDRGHINWRLVGLDVEGAQDPSPQDLLESDAKPKAGRITSAARLPDGRGVAMALLHVSGPAGSSIRVRHGEQIITARVRG